MERCSAKQRVTNETKIDVAISLDGGNVDRLLSKTCTSKVNKATEHASQITGSQSIQVDTGIGFLDHASSPNNKKKK